jgi:hypothetical protein
MCKLDKLLDAFKSNPRRHDGLQSQCAECHAEYRRKHYLANREKYIKKAASWKKNFQAWWKEYKKQFKCSRCPEQHPACIQFHHPNDDKELGVSQWVGRGDKERVLEEIAKCIPLCGNCHAKEHWKD